MPFMVVTPRLITIIHFWRSSGSLLETTASPTSECNYSVQWRSFTWNTHSVTYSWLHFSTKLKSETWTIWLVNCAEMLDRTRLSFFLNMPQVARFRRRPDTVPQTGFGPGVPTHSARLTHSGFYIPLQAQTTAGSCLTYLWRRLNVPLNSFTRHCSPPLHRLWW